MSWIHAQTLQDTYTRTSEIEKISERVLRDSNVLYLPTQHTYVPQTPPTSFIYVYAKSVKSWGVHRMCGVGFRTLAPSGACVWKCFFFVWICVSQTYTIWFEKFEIRKYAVSVRKISNRIAFFGDPEKYTLHFHSLFFKKKRSNSGEREKIRFKSYMVRKKSLCSVGSSCVTNKW